MTRTTGSTTPYPQLQFRFRSVMYNGGMDDLPKLPFDLKPDTAFWVIDDVHVIAHTNEATFEFIGKMGAQAWEEILTFRNFV